MTEKKWFISNIDPVKIELPETIKRLKGRKELTHEEVCELEREGFLEYYVLSVGGSIKSSFPIDAKEWKCLVGTSN